MGRAVKTWTTAWALDLTESPRRAPRRPYVPTRDPEPGGRAGVGRRQRVSASAEASLGSPIQAPTQPRWLRPQTCVEEWDSAGRVQSAAG